MAEAFQTVYEILQASAARQGDCAFVEVLPETARAYDIAAEEITYRDMLSQADGLRALYRDAGYGCGHRVGLLLENRPAFFAHWFALNALGVSVVPINPDYRTAELAYLIAHSEIVAAICIEARQTDLTVAAREANVLLPIFGPSDPPIPVTPKPKREVPHLGTECALLYTSGTTGKPKGCVLTNQYFKNAGDWYLTAGGRIQLTRGVERMLTPLPLFHMNAMSTSTMTMLMSGGCLIVLDRFHPKTWWSSVRDSKATIVHYLGVMPPILMAAPASSDDKRHHVAFGFGAGVNRTLHSPFESRFGFPLIEAWAMTETGGGVVIADNHEPRRVGTSCFGKPGRECEVRIIDDHGRDAGADENGELLVRRAGSDPRHGFFSAYLKEPQATQEAWQDGWFHTGDVVRRDVDGFLYFVDRKKNVIRRSGENIASVEVEGTLLQHPDVMASGVAPVLDEVRGEEVFAAIVLHPGRAPTVDMVQSIIHHCRERMAYYKVPGYIAFVPSLPLTSTQKIQRGALKTLASDLMSSSGTHDIRALKKRTT